MFYLKQSTAKTLRFGPFLDSSDGTSAATSLTINQADVKLSKNGGALAQSNDTGGGTHDADGFYAIQLDATDTNTLGPLGVSIQVTGALPFFKDFHVLSANVYDSLFAGSDNLETDPVAINGVAAAAARLALSANQIIPADVDGVTHSPTTTEFETADITEATEDHFIGRVIIFTSGDLIAQATEITDYALSGSNGHFTVSALTEAPGDGDAFIIV